jgi:hypothetical protein
MMAESMREPTIPYDFYMTGKELQNRYSKSIGSEKTEKLVGFAHTLTVEQRFQWPSGISY